MQFGRRCRVSAAGETHRAERVIQTAADEHGCKHAWKIFREADVSHEGVKNNAERDHSKGMRVIDTLSQRPGRLQEPHGARCTAGPTIRHMGCLPGQRPSDPVRFARA